MILDDTDDLLGAILGQLLAGSFTRDLLVLAEIRLCARRLPVVDARVERDDGDARRNRTLESGFDRFRPSQCDSNSCDIAVDGVLHEVRLVRSLKFCRILQLDVVLLCGSLGTLADEVPEGVTGGPVSDHRDRDARGIRLAGIHTRVRRSRLAAGARTCREERRGCSRSPRCGSLLEMLLHWILLICAGFSRQRRSWPP